MTFCVGQATLLSLTMQKSDLEYKILSISNKRQIIAYQTAALAGSDTDSPEMAQLQAIDQVYELEQTSLETQEKMVSAEFDGVQKMVENNIKKDCKLNLS